MASVTGNTDCGIGSASCSSFASLCADSAWTSSHEDNADCYGWSNNAAGQTVQCWEPGGSDSNWPLLQCDSLQCAIDQAAELALRVTPVPLGRAPLAGVVIFDLVDQEVAYSCTSDFSACVNVPPTCARLADGKACWV